VGPVANCYVTQVRRLECDTTSAPAASSCPRPRPSACPSSRSCTATVGGSSSRSRSCSRIASTPRCSPPRSCGLGTRSRCATGRRARRARQREGRRRARARHAAHRCRRARSPRRPPRSSARASGRLAGQRPRASGRGREDRLHLVNSSQAWEVWAKLAEVAERRAARIYLGTDGVLGAQGGAPGVDISRSSASRRRRSRATSLHRARRADRRDLARGPRSTSATTPRRPTRTYVFPDPDEAEVRETSQAERRVPQMGSCSRRIT
jgi:hypothetical protein